MKKSIQITILIVFSGLLNMLWAQSNGNCSHDQNYNDILYYPQGYHDVNHPNDWNYLCDKYHPYLDGPMELLTKPYLYSIPDWQLVYYDDFDVLDKGFWYRLPFSNVAGSSTGNHQLAANLPENNVISNGTLVQKITYNPGATYPALWADETPSGQAPVTADWWCSSIMSRLTIPINSRIQGNIKVIGGENYTWPAFWLFGNNSLELDIFEIVGKCNENDLHNTPHPGNWLRATTHSTKYGYPYNSSSDALRQEGLAFNTQAPLADNFHFYELFWDQYKVQWWFDSSPYYTNNRFYRTYSRRSQWYYRNYWRKYPVTDPSGIIIPDYNDRYRYLINRYFPDGLDYNGNILIGFGLRNSPDLSQGSSDAIALQSIIANTSQQVDMFAFWLRSNCQSGENIVNNLQFYGQTNSYSQTAYETGYSITVPSTAQISLGPTYTGDLLKHSIFAATNEITINGEFEVNTGSFFLAHITACTPAWDTHNRTMNVNLDSLYVADSLALAVDSLLANEEFAYRVMNTHFEAFAEQSSFIQVSQTSDQIKIVSPNEIISSVEVLDLSSKVIFSEKNINLNEYYINKHMNFTTGLYVLRVNGSQSVIVQRIWLSND